MMQFELNTYIPHVYCLVHELLNEGCLLISTNAGESTSNAIIDYINTVVITLTTTCPHTPEQSMIIEQVWRTIGESAIAMRLSSSLSAMHF